MGRVGEQSKEVGAGLALRRPGRCALQQRRRTAEWATAATAARARGWQRAAEGRLRPRSRAEPSGAERARSLAAAACHMPSPPQRAP